MKCKCTVASTHCYYCMMHVCMECTDNPDEHEAGTRRCKECKEDKNLEKETKVTKPKEQRTKLEKRTQLQRKNSLNEIKSTPNKVNLEKKEDTIKRKSEESPEQNSQPKTKKDGKELEAVTNQGDCSTEEN